MTKVAEVDVSGNFYASGELIQTYNGAEFIEGDLLHLDFTVAPAVPQTFTSLAVMTDVSDGVIAGEFQSYGASNRIVSGYGGQGFFANDGLSNWSRQGLRSHVPIPSAAGRITFMEMYFEYSDNFQSAAGLRNDLSVFTIPHNGFYNFDQNSGGMYVNGVRVTFSMGNQHGRQKVAIIDRGNGNSYDFVRKLPVSNTWYLVYSSVGETPSETNYFQFSNWRDFNKTRNGLYRVKIPAQPYPEMLAEASPDYSFLDYLF